jgi:hypothetical protein
MGCWAAPMFDPVCGITCSAFVQTLNRRDGESWSSITPDGAGR